MPDHTLFERVKGFAKRASKDRRLTQRRKAKATTKGRAKEVADTEAKLEQKPVTVTVTVDEQLFGSK